MTEDMFKKNEGKEEGNTAAEGSHQFFNCEILTSAFKDDTAGMDVPIFTLQTKTPDLSTVEWTSADGSHYLKVIPSVMGRATQLDKDLLIYAISQLTEGLNKGREDAKSRVIKFKIYDYLKATGKSTGGSSYLRVREQLERLRGTSLSTSIKTGKKTTHKGFGLIDEWETTEKGADGMIYAIEMTLSQWMFNSVQAREVLTINPAYFLLKKTMERKLYEIARKHCGSKKSFKMSFDVLLAKVGSSATAREFRRSLKEIIMDDNIPDYTFELQDSTGNVLIINDNPVESLE